MHVVFRISLWLNSSFARSDLKSQFCLGRVGISILLGEGNLVNLEIPVLPAQNWNSNYAWRKAPVYLGISVLSSRNWNPNFARSNSKFAQIPILPPTYTYMTFHGPLHRKGVLTETKSIELGRDEVSCYSLFFVPIVSN